MHWFVDVLRQHTELTLFLTLALGYGLGSVPLGGFRLGAVLGTLIAGLVVGQVGIDVPAALQSAFFLMFMFAIGYRTGPEFFRSLRSKALPQVALSTLLCVTALALMFGLSWLMHFDGGTAAGVLAGALTSSAALGTATNTVSTLGLPEAAARALGASVTTAYAITYLLGTVLVVWLLPRLGPRLMRVDLARACREIEKEMGIQEAADPGLMSAYQEIVVRAYRLPPSLAGRSVAELEGMWPAGRRVVVARIRRGGEIREVNPSTGLEAGDVLALAGRQESLVGDVNPLPGEEVHDRELLSIPVVSGDIVVTDRSVAGQTIEALHRTLGSRGIFLLKIQRGGQEIPVGWRTVIERGDVLTVTGYRPEIERVAALVGFSEWPTTATDLVLVGGGIFLGGLLGLLALPIGRIELGLSLAVGVLLAGLVLGHLRSVNPRFGRIPEASLWLFDSLGLTAFLALVGLGTGPAVVSGLLDAGPRLLLAALVLVLVPHAVTILVGHYVLKVNPGILLGVCAGAGTSAPALAAVQEAARSKVPALGYGMACALGNVLLALWATLAVLLLPH